MKVRIRIKEDWLELIVIIGLVFVAVSDLLKGNWFVASVALVFLVATIYLWWKQARSRWCWECQKPMRRILVDAYDSEKIVFVCDKCGRRIDSGVQVNHTE